MRVLIVEDEDDLAAAVARGLRRKGLAVDVASDGRQALAKAGVVSYDVVVLDRDLPEIHGDEVCRRMSALDPPPAVLMLTAASEVGDRVAGLAIGADDYLGKPFAFAELAARVLALGRRVGRPRPPVLAVADVELDTARRQARRSGRELPLTAKEFGVLEALIVADGCVLSAEELLTRVWDENADPFTAAVRVTMFLAAGQAGQTTIDRDTAPRRLPDRAWRVSRLSLRTRLALLIGLLLVVSGAVLLAVSYGLVNSNLNAKLNVGGEPGISASPARPQSNARQPTLDPSGGPRASPRTPTSTPSQARTQQALAERTLDQLVTQYLVVLAGIVLVAVALGWLLAGRLLRSVRRITSVAQRVTGHNLDERIGLHGPRDELRELADTFDGMLARLDAVFSAQRRFIADASHELRTPLATMRAELEVLAADPNPAVADVEAATLVLRRQLARSEELIEALLALAGSEPELLACTTVDLGEIAREALDDAATGAVARRLRIDARLASAPVQADRRLLTLMVGNLLNNAIKHNRDAGWLKLRTAVQAERALLVVANSGSVVPPDEVGHLTEAFRRGGRARIGDGHGLGLAIVAAVTHAHRGELTIEPVREGGLRVETSLPLAVHAVLDTPAVPDTNEAAGKVTSTSGRDG
jgi:DNA-binding response OmpR family regulator/signal transduction histidine kinase